MMKKASVPDLSDYRPLVRSEELKKLELDILKAFHIFCEEKSLHYMLSFGSLLGAVRHNGYIPWDDDIDVIMPRWDYEIFLTAFDEWGKDRGLYTACPSSREHFFPNDFAKVCRSDTILSENAMKWKYQMGVFIDVFPIDGLPGGKLRRKAVLGLLRLLMYIRVASSFDLDSTDYQSAYHYTALKRAAIRLLNAFPTGQIIHLGQKIKTASELDRSEYAISNDGIRFYRKEWFDHQILHAFEDTECYIPAEYKKVLEAQFGPDYMTPPPEKYRTPHHIQNVWIRKEKEKTESGRFDLAKGEPLLSVIVPIYMVEAYLRDCVDSLLPLGAAGAEILLINDESPDGSGVICEEYARKYPFIRFQTISHGGLSCARNAGLDMAKGKYIVFVDSDDRSDAEELLRILHLMEEQNLEIASFDGQSIDDAGRPCLNNPFFGVWSRADGRIKEEIISGRLFWNRYFPRQGVLLPVYMYAYRRDFLEKHQLRFQPGVYYEDNVWTFLAHYYAERFRYFPRAAYYRRLHAGTIVQGKNGKLRFEEEHLRSCLTLRKEIKACYKLDPQGAGYLDDCNLDRLALGKDMRDTAAVQEMIRQACAEIDAEWDASAEEERVIMSRYMLTLRRYYPKGTVISPEFLNKMRQLGKRMLPEQLFDKSKTVGIYGTGAVAKRLMQYLLDQFDGELSEIRFFETKPAPGRRFMTKTVMPIDSEAAGSCSIILLGSPKNEEAMAAEAARCGCRNICRIPDGTEWLIRIYDKRG